LRLNSFPKKDVGYRDSTTDLGMKMDADRDEK